MLSHCTLKKKKQTSLAWPSGQYSLLLPPHLLLHQMPAATGSLHMLLPLQSLIPFAPRAVRVLNHSDCVNSLYNTYSGNSQWSFFYVFMC